MGLTNARSGHSGSATLADVEVRAVRPAEHREAGRVTALAYREFAPPGHRHWEAYLATIEDVAGRAGRTPVLVAVENGRVLGSATLEFDDVTLGDDDEVLPPEMASIRMLGVDPSARGRGVGRALVEGCIREARARGKAVLVLRTTERMTAAQRLYRSMGFRRDPARDLVVGERHRLIAYRLELA